MVLQIILFRLTQMRNPIHVYTLKKLHLLSSPTGFNLYICITSSSTITSLSLSTRCLNMTNVFYYFKCFFNKVSTYIGQTTASTIYFINTTLFPSPESQNTFVSFLEMQKTSDWITSILHKEKNKQKKCPNSWSSAYKHKQAFLRQGQLQI